VPPPGLPLRFISLEIYDEPQRAQMVAILDEQENRAPRLAENRRHLEAVGTL